MEDFGEGCAMMLVVIAMLLIVNLVYAAIACWLWNGIVVAVFGAPVLTYWQTYGLMLLINLVAPNRVNTSRKD